MATQEDRDTQEVMEDGEELVGLTRSRGWAIAREKLISLIMDLQNIHNVDDTSIDNVVVDMKSRKLAVGILYGWLKDVEGSAQQHESNRDMLGESSKKDDDFIERH